jgi:predicted acyltransferase
MSSNSEISKDRILTQLKASTILFGATVTETINRSTTGIAVVAVAVLLVILFVCIVGFAYFGIISVNKAGALLVVGVICVLILGYIFAAFSTVYTKRRIGNVVLLLNNYFASEEALENINGAAQAYLTATAA